MVKLIHRFVMACVASLAIGAFIGCGESASTPPGGGTTQPGGTEASYKCAGCGKTAKSAATASAPSC